MGCCTSRHEDDDDTVPDFGARKMQSLKQHSWTSSAPMTRLQLEKEREEFWDISPSYGGKPEVWQVLKAACEEQDHSLVQAILDAGRVTVPSNRAVEQLTPGETGSGGGGGGRSSSRYDPMAQFTCFDHLGNMYVIPIKCISFPRNLIEIDTEASTDDDNGTGAERQQHQTSLMKNGQTSSSPEVSPSSMGPQTSHAGSINSKSTGQSSTSKKEQAKKFDNNNNNNKVHGSSQDQSSSTLSEVASTETVRVRLSNTQKETLLTVPRTATMGQIKQQLQNDPLTANLVQGQSRLRFFFLGRILEDKVRLVDVPHFELGGHGTVLQVQVSDS